MERLTVNNEVVIYPNEKGFKKMVELVAVEYNICEFDAMKWVNRRKTKDGGYKDQLWVIIQNFHPMFYNGQQYFKNTYIDFV